MAANAQAARDSAAPVLHTWHSYTSVVLSSGHSAMFVSKQTGDTIKTLETNYAKYLPDADSRRDMIEALIRESADKVRSRISRKYLSYSAVIRERKSPWFPKGLNLERVRRVELPTLCLASIRSSQLSYTRVEFFYYSKPARLSIIRVSSTIQA